MTETATGTGAYQTSYGYDANGSVTSTHRTGTGAADTTSTWDLRNRLATYTAGGVVTAYSYDSDGDRVSKSSNAGATYYLVDGQNPTGYAQVLEESASQNGTPTITYLLGQDVIGQAATNGTVTYLGSDGHGSTRFLTSDTGVVTANGASTTTPSAARPGSTRTPPGPSCCTSGSPGTGSRAPSPCGAGRSTPRPLGGSPAQTRRTSHRASWQTPTRTSTRTATQ